MTDFWRFCDEWTINYLLLSQFTLIMNLALWIKIPSIIYLYVRTNLPGRKLEPCYTYSLRSTLKNCIWFDQVLDFVLFLCHHPGCSHSLVFDGTDFR